PDRLEVAQLLREQNPQVSAITVTTSGPPGWVKRATDSGVDSFTPADAPREHLAEGIRRMMPAPRGSHPERPDASTTPPPPPPAAMPPASPGRTAGCRSAGTPFSGCGLQRLPPRQLRPRTQDRALEDPCGQQQRQQRGDDEDGQRDERFPPFDCAEEDPHR